MSMLFYASEPGNVQKVQLSTVHGIYQMLSDADVA